MIIRNIARCTKCNTTIESKSVHDFQQCKCKNIFVDGGKQYLRRGAKNLQYFEDLSKEDVHR